MASPPFVIDISTPGDDDFRSIYPANERNFRDIVDSWLKIDHNTQGRHNKVSFEDMDGSEPTFAAGVMGIYQDDGILFARLASGTPIDLTSFKFTTISGTGILVKNDDDTAVVRTLTAGNSGVVVTNGSGVTANPTISLSTNMQNLHEVATAGFLARNAAGTTWAARTLTAGNTGISISNGNGISDNPTVSLAVHQGTSSGGTDFPIGHIVLVTSTTLPNRNEEVTIRLSAGDSRGYTDFGGGSTLSGTWRSRGSFLDTGSGGFGLYLAQRVA